jgi:hypothetical protein
VILKNVTNNQGLVPIEVGLARLQSSQHTFVHYYSLIEIRRHLDNLDLYYKNVSNYFVNSISHNVSNNIEYVSDNGSKIRDIVNYFRFINHTINIINEKLEIVFVDKAYVTRNKRGIFNGLGTVLKTITGNLDANDGEKYDEIIDDLRFKQKTLENQVNSQYSVNTNIILEFNRTIFTVQENFNELERKLLLVNKRINNYIELEKIRDILNQLLISYNIMLSLVRDIENSLTFCKLKTMHPSIMSTKELFYEIKKVSKFYDNQLPLEVKVENMFDFESIMDVDCRINLKEIVYFLNLPLVEKTEFKLIKLYPIPTKYKLGYVTLIPKVKYVIKSISTLENIRIDGLDENCKEISNSKFICSSDHLTHRDIDCETSFVISETTDNCKYTALDISESLIKWIPEMHQYLFVFPRKESLKLVSSTETSTYNLQGIFLIDTNNSKIFYKNKELHHSTTTKGHPKLTSNVELNLRKNQEPEFSINLKHLEFDNIDINNVSPVVQQPYISTELDIYTSILYVAVIIVIIYLAYKKITKKDSHGPEPRPPPDVLFRDGGVRC